MKRPKQHIIDTQAQALFKQSLPSEWVIRPMVPDYGIDYEVEIVEKGLLTGFTFYVQLKGTLSPKYADGSLCLPFEVEKLRYYSERVNMPVLIVVADLTNQTCLWLYIQKYIREVLRPSNPHWYSQKRVTLFLPGANKIPETWESLAQVAKEGVREELIKQFGRPPLRLTLEIEDKLGDPQAIAEAIKQNDLESATVKFDLIDACIEIEDRGQALRELEKLFESTKTNEMPEIHIESAIRLVDELGILDPSVFEKCVNILDQALSRADECAYKGVVLVARATKILLFLLFNSMRVMESRVFIDIATHSKSGMEDMLKLQQTQHWVGFQAADDALRSLIHESIKSNEIRAACHITAMLAQAYSSIYPMMRLVEGEEISTPIATSAEQLLEYSEKLALSLHNPSLRCFVMQTKAQLQFVTRDKGYEATLGEMKNIALSAKLRPFIKSADTLLQGMKSNEKELWGIEPSSNNNKTPLSLEEEAATIRSVAKMTRVDLEDDDDPIAQTINLAIRDLNPERIVKFCKHLHVQYTSSGGIYADQYGLGSAGGKVIYCELKDKAVEGMQLDGILEVFKLRSCKECEMRSPRPEKWKLTREWKRERQANMPEGLIRYLRKAYG